MHITYHHARFASKAMTRNMAPEIFKKQKAPQFICAAGRFKK